MRILHAAAECYPVIHTGGLGDVIGALPRAQAALGGDVRLVLPGYPAVMAALTGAGSVGDQDSPFGPIRIRGGRFAGSSLPVYAIEAPVLYDRPGNPYVMEGGAEWPDNGRRFGLLGWAAAALAAGQLDPDWQADILQAHDWHAGLAPAWVRALGRPAPATVFTVHNIAFQGLFPPDALPLPPLGGGLPAGLEYWGKVSFMKAGLSYADRITTVSPGYAREMATPEFGNGLEGVVAERAADVTGILNGVDGAVWNPATDLALPARFGPTTLKRRKANRDALIEAFELVDAGGPLYGVVSRLTGQKGIDLVLDAMPAVLGENGMLVVLGSGDAGLEAGLRREAGLHPGRVGLALRFDDTLAHRIIGGADAILVPSRFEPCGLTQLYAMRYGTVPVARRTGGLGDSIADATETALEEGSATGILFDEPSPASLAGALDRAAALYADPIRWRRVQRAGMNSRFAWDEAAAAYLALYRTITSAP